MTTATVMTVEEFAQLPTPDSEAYELVEGELVPLAAPSPHHSDVCRNVEFAAYEYFRKNPIGTTYREVNCRLGPGTIRRPDVAIFLFDRLRDADRSKGPFPFAPDIAVEVLSPSELAVENNRKVHEYLAAGGKEVWVIDQANGEIFVRTASNTRQVASGDVLMTPLLPGFSVPVDELLKVY